MNVKERKLLMVHGVMRMFRSRLDGSWARMDKILEIGGGLGWRQGSKTLRHARSVFKFDEAGQPLRNRRCCCYRSRIVPTRCWEHLGPFKGFTRQYSCRTRTGTTIGSLADVEDDPCRKQSMENPMDAVRRRSAGKI